MSDRYKQMCSCLTCLKMKMFQQSLNIYRKNLLQFLKRSHSRTTRGGSRRRAAANNISVYESQTDFSESVRSAVTRVHCEIAITTDAPIFDGFFHIDCAYSSCKSCPKYELHNYEKQLMMQDKVSSISFHTYELIYQCSEHGTLSDGQTECLYCADRIDGQRKGKILVRNKLVGKNIPFKFFLRITT